MTLSSPLATSRVIARDADEVSSALSQRRIAECHSLESKSDSVGELAREGGLGVGIEMSSHAVW